VLAVVAAEHLVAAHWEQAELVAGGMPGHLMMGMPIQVAAGVAQKTTELIVAMAAQASSSFHTQAQPNYLVVELLPNQAVTSFTHSHLLAHLALFQL
jgi:hypothetical protein